jgi:hypothetical protein
VVLLHGYCLNMLRENRTLKRAATDSSGYWKCAP